MKNLARAKSQIILNHPFFATALMRMPVLETEAIPTAATDGHSILYNKTFFESLSPQEIEFILCHEVGHCMMLHLTRVGSRNKLKWNAAADYALNLVLVDAGMKMPKGGLLDKKYKDMTTEQIYNKIPENLMNKILKDMWGDLLEPKNGNMTEEEWKAITAQAAQAAQVAGKLPNGLERFVNDLLRPVVNWPTVLRDFVQKSVPSDYSWCKPNRRWLNRDLIFPGITPDAVHEIVIAVDTSGSISEEILRRFASEVNAIHRELNIQRTIVIYCDAAIQKVEEFSQGEHVKIKGIGGGGTAFSPVFKHLENHQVDCLVYFTDLCCNDYGVEPWYPVLWACVGRYREENPPFGAVLDVE